MAEQTRNKPRGRQPITRHPLFAVTVALWCGAILSLAGAVAAPRVGVPLILGLAAIGGMAGLILARRIARSRLPVAQGTAIVATEDESASPLWSELRTRRRALEEESAGDFAEPDVPVLARKPEILDITIADSEPLPPEGAAAPLVEEPVAETAAPPRSRPESAAAARLKQADLDDLSHLQLLERLALGLERRRSDAGSDAASAAATTPPPTSHVAALKRSYQALVDLAQQVPPPQPAAGDPPVVSAAHAGRSAVPRLAGPAATALAYDPVETSEAAAPPHDPGETDKALRAALAALQRMSGAA